jgi:hypothetical protein
VASRPTIRSTESRKRCEVTRGKSAAILSPLREMTATELRIAAYLTACVGDRALETIGTTDIATVNPNTNMPSPVRMNFAFGSLVSGMRPSIVHPSLDHLACASAPEIPNPDSRHVDCPFRYIECLRR